MRRPLALAAALLTVAPVVAIAPAGPADDVAWFAEYLGVPVAELPSEFPTLEGAFGPGAAPPREGAVAVADLAARVRHAVGYGADAEARFAGAGARSLRFGVSWFGGGAGFPSTMACIRVTEAAATPDTPAGAAHALVHVEVPANAFGGGFGVAGMDVQAQPTPSVGGSFVPTTSADFALLKGGWVAVCYISFTLRFTSAFVFGDGAVHGDGGL